jgi:hypothetical protein
MVVHHEPRAVEHQGLRPRRLRVCVEHDRREKVQPLRDERTALLPVESAPTDRDTRSVRRPGVRGAVANRYERCRDLAHRKAVTARGHRPSVVMHCAVARVAHAGCRDQPR